MEPKSSPSELREHPFFNLKTTEGSVAPVCWETLWTTSAPSIESGIVPPPEENTVEFDWDAIIHQFSLVGVDEDAPGAAENDENEPTDETETSLDQFEAANSLTSGNLPVIF